MSEDFEDEESELSYSQDDRPGSTGVGGRLEPADPSQCLIDGLRAGQKYPVGSAGFRITAVDSNGARKRGGGDSFFIAIRGASRVRARIEDCENGTYRVAWQPKTSGSYQIAVSIFGAALKGSPFNVQVHDASPHAACCLVRGEALHAITARTPSAFEVLFKDHTRRTAQAVELDVYVERLLDDSQSDSHEGGAAETLSGGEGGASTGTTAARRAWWRRSTE